jgi:hypothetical protein
LQVQKGVDGGVKHKKRKGKKLKEKVWLGGGWGVSWFERWWSVWMLEECLCCCEERAENHRLPGFIYRDNKIRKSPKHSKLLEILQVLSWSRNPLTNLHSTSRYFFSLLLKINLYSLLHFIKYHTNRLVWLSLAKKGKTNPRDVSSSKTKLFFDMRFQLCFTFQNEIYDANIVFSNGYTLRNEKTVTSQGDADAFIYVKIRLKL